MTPAPKSHETRERASYAPRICARPKSTHRSSPAPEHVQVSDIGNRGPRKYGPDGWERSASGERDAPHLFSKSPAMGARSAFLSALRPSAACLSPCARLLPRWLRSAGAFPAIHSFGNFAMPRAPLTDARLHESASFKSNRSVESVFDRAATSGGDCVATVAPRISQVAT